MSTIDFLLFLAGKESNTEFERIVNEVKHHADNTSDPYYSCSNQEILNVFDVSWGQSIKQQVNVETVYYAYSLYFFDAINYETFRAFILYCIQNEILTNEDSVKCYILDKLKSKKSKEQFSYFEYLDYSRELGTLPALFSPFKQTLNYFDADISLDMNEVAKAELLEKTVISLKERSQYLEELSSSVSPEILLYLDYFLDQQLLSDMAYFIYKNLATKIDVSKPLSLAKFQELYEQTLLETKLPFVPASFDPILASHSSNISPKTVSMDDLQNAPPKRYKEFALSKAYSCPKSAQKIRITFLGGGGIGTMAILIQHNNNAILLDCGMSVANYSIPRWHPALKFVKTVLVTHAHLDHTGALPYFIRPESGKSWYASAQTKKLTELLLYNTSSLIDEINASFDNLPPFYSSLLKKANLINLFNVFESITTKKSIEAAPGFEVTAYPSSHLFGSYGYEIDIFGTRVLFTGDFSINDSALFKGAKMPTDSDITIFDGTYYNRNSSCQPVSLVLSQAAEKCQRILIPAFSLGRSQEMLKRVEQAGLDKKFNVKLVGLSSKVTSLMGVSGNYRGYNTLSPEEFEAGDIVIAGNGMLQGGTARTLLEATKDDDTTGVILCGYQAPNTLGYALKTGHPVALQRYHQQIFDAKVSGHSSAHELDNFIMSLKGKKIMIHTPKNTKLKPEHKNVVIPRHLQSMKFSINKQL